MSNQPVQEPIRVLIGGVDSLFGSILVSKLLEINAFVLATAKNKGAVPEGVARVIDVSFPFNKRLRD